MISGETTAVSNYSIWKPLEIEPFQVEIPNSIRQHMTLRKLIANERWIFSSQIFCWPHSGISRCIRNFQSKCTWVGDPTNLIRRLTNKSASSRYNRLTEFMPNDYQKRICRFKSISVESREPPNFWVKCNWSTSESKTNFQIAKNSIKSCKQNWLLKQLNFVSSADEQIKEWLIEFLSLEMPGTARYY